MLSYAYNLKKYGQLYGKLLNRKQIQKILKNVEYIYVYGPDVGRMEKAYNLNLRDNYNCVNLLTVVKNYIPGLYSHKLDVLERYYEIERKVSYKMNIFKLYSAWNNPAKRQDALTYNMEDTLNLVKVKNALFKEHKITNKQLQKYIM